MKFGENLKGNLTSEWKSQYVDYEGLKSIICRFEGGKEGDAGTFDFLTQLKCVKN